MQVHLAIESAAKTCGLISQSSFNDDFSNTREESQAQLNYEKELSSQELSIKDTRLPSDSSLSEQLNIFNTSDLCLEKVEGMNDEMYLELNVGKSWSAASIDQNFYCDNGEFSFIDYSDNNYRALPYEHESLIDISMSEYLNPASFVQNKERMDVINEVLDPRMLDNLTRHQKFAYLKACRSTLEDLLRRVDVQLDKIIS